VVVANVAIALADKTPVNLNFTVGRAALQSANSTSADSFRHLG